MADPADTIESLTDQQRLALEQFTAVTAQDVSDAIPLLARCEWNVQIAIARFFDGDPPPAPAEPTAPPPESTRRQETLLDSIPLAARPRHPALRALQPAPRIVATPESQLNAQPPLLLSLSLAPLNILLGLFSRLYSLVSVALPFLPTLLLRLSSRLTTFSSIHNPLARRITLAPQATADRFTSEFHDTYGDAARQLPLLQTTYSRAYDTAKTDLKFLLVVPLASEHQHTDNFVRDVLLSPTVIEYVKNPENHTLVWAGSTADAEAYTVSTALGVGRFPTALLIAHTPDVSSTAMSVLTRVEGQTDAETLLTRLREASSRFGESLAHLRASRQDRHATQTLRDEQQSAYERSLATDRARVAAKREAEAARMHAERSAKDAQTAAETRARNAAQWRKWRAARIAAEPPPDVQGACRVSVRLADGTRAVRRFAGDAPLEEVYAYVECYNELRSGDLDNTSGRPVAYEHVYGFKLVEMMPRRVHALQDDDGGGSVSARIGRSANLVAERIEDGESDED